MIDAGNACNSLNRKAALHNISMICTSFSSVLINIYRDPVRLIIPGDGEIQSCEGTTQGDPLAMAMYALAITPLIRKLNECHPETKQVWYNDDATGAGTCINLRKWWDFNNVLGPKYGYFPKSSKTQLVVKPGFEESARSVFEGTQVHITAGGARHLGAAIGSRKSKEEFITKKVDEWIDEVKVLADIASTQPHAVYSALTHGVFGRWSFITRAVPDIIDFLLPLEHSLHQILLPALTGRPPSSKIDREIIALPARLGGLGIPNPSTHSQSSSQASITLTAALVNGVIAQDLDRSVSCVDINLINDARKKIRNTNRLREICQANKLDAQLSAAQRRLISLAKEKGASSWLTAVPVEEHGFFLNKGEFRDALHLRYGWDIQNTPKSCVCGTSFSIDHAMTCKRGRFTIMRHNEIQDITAKLLTEVCYGVVIEPSLQPLSGETFSYGSAIVDAEARLDIKARGFWNKTQDAFFDVQVFHPNAPSYRSKDISVLYKQHESAKRREYNQRVRDVEHGVFTPLVFSTTGSMGREGTTFNDWLTSYRTSRGSHILS